MTENKLGEEIFDTSREGELNLGFDEDAAMRECIGMSLDGSPPLQLLEHVYHLPVST